jgi:diguanylate cyclase
LATGDPTNTGEGYASAYGFGCPADQDTMSGRAWRVYLAGGMAAVALYFLLPLEGLWSSLAYDLIGLSSVAAILVGVRHLRPARPLIWWCFAAGQLLFVVGDMLYSVIDTILHQSPFPSVADGFYLGGYPVLAVGLLVLIRGRISDRDRAGLIDAAIIATGFGLLSWTFLMKPIATDASLSLLEQLISLAYPLGDVLLLAMVARLATSPGSRTTAYRLLGLALVLLLAADIGYAVLALVSSYEGGLVDAGWLLSYVIWGAAALHPSMRSMSEVAPDQATRFTHRRLALLATTSLMAPAVLVQQGLRHQPIDVGAIAFGSVVLFLLVVLRMAGLVAQVQGQSAKTQHQALHDALTGLPNRALLRDRTDQAIHQADRELAPAALLLIDLDRFKEVNDTLGHHHGDQLLVQVGQRLQAALRTVDTVARLGGDEFAVLLPRIQTAEGAVAVASKLLAGFDEPFRLEDLALDVEASIGVALYPEHGSDPDELLQRADIAMYVAKDTHAGFVLFDPKHDQHSPDRLALLGELRRAIDHQQLVLHYQPKVDAHTGQMLGVEALVRWQHPDHGLIPPNDFLPLAERTGLIGLLTNYVLDAALHQCREWRQAGHELAIAVNVSARSLLDLAFPNQVADLLARWELPARLLMVEITESTIMTDPTHALKILGQLNAMGVQIAIDDFGTGYSSMAHLKTLPVHELKIDRSFVSHMTSNNRDAVIVHTTVDLGRNLGLRVVAEGVEDLQTLQELDALGCDAIQGYYISRPVPADDLIHWLEQQHAATPTPQPHHQGIVA